MADERFSFRWGIPWLDAGFVQVPDFFFETYGQLGVTRVEFLFILHLSRYKYESPRGRSRPSLGTIATQMSVSRRHVCRLRNSLEKKGLLIVTERPGRPSEYDFGNFALAALRKAQKADENVTHDLQVMPTLDTHVIPPMTPRSTEEHETSKEDNNNPVVVVCSPSAEEGKGADMVGQLGLSEKMVEELNAQFGTARVHAVVRAVLGRNSVRDKAAWAISALRRGWEMGQDPAETANDDTLRLTAKNCMFVRKPSLGDCPTEEDGVRLAHWCRACPRGEAVPVV